MTHRAVEWPVRYSVSMQGRAAAAPPRSVERSGAAVGAEGRRVELVPGPEAEEEQKGTKGSGASAAGRSVRRSAAGGHRLGRLTGDSGTDERSGATPHSGIQRFRHAATGGTTGARAFPEGLPPPAARGFESPAGRSRLQEAAEGRDGVDSARRGPVAELGHVHSAVPSLAVVDPALRALETLAEGSLGQGRLLAEASEEVWDGPVAPGVLGLGGHSTYFPCREA